MKGARSEAALVILTSLVIILLANTASQPAHAWQLGADTADDASGSYDGIRSVQSAPGSVSSFQSFADVAAFTDSHHGRLWNAMVGLEANPNSPYYGYIFWYNNQTQVWGPKVTYWNSWQILTMKMTFGYSSGGTYYGPISFDFTYGTVTRTGIIPTLFHQSPGGYSYVAYTAQAVNAYPNPPSQKTFGWGDFSDYTVQIIGWANPPSTIGQSIVCSNHQVNLLIVESGYTQYPDGGDATSC